MNDLQEIHQLKPRSKLWNIYQHGDKMYLRAYADTIITQDNQGEAKTLVAIRFGGYPEMVRAMSDAIYGGGTFSVKKDSEEFVFLSKTKQYRRILSNDGTYAEATLLINDDDFQEKKDTEQIDADENKEKPKNSVPGNTYIFCEKDNINSLFEGVDKKTIVPLIPEFTVYVISELQKQNILQKLSVLSVVQRFDAYKLSLSANDENIISVVEQGLSTGMISIPKGISNHSFEEINSVSGYLKSYGVSVAEKIKSLFTPLFDPATEKLSAEVLDINNNIQANVGYSLYDAQLAVAESIKRRLQIDRVGLCVAECGSGKSKMGTMALGAYQMKKVKSFNVILCTANMSKKWVREISETLPNTFAIHIKSIAELTKAYNAYKKDSKTCYVILTKEKARDGYMVQPAVFWNKRQNAFLCPHCYKPIMMNIFDDGTKYEVNADHYFFQKQTKKNRNCKACGNII